MMNMVETALVARLFPQETILRNLGIVFFGAVLTALCAQASIPLWPVPLTLQTMAVTLCGLSMGVRLAIWSQITYIAAGCVGMPVFANGAAGIANLAGPTGGYLVAFVAAAGLLGYATERGLTKSAVEMATALVIANFLILALGTAWLAFFVPQGKAMELGFYPFLVGAVIKSLMVVGFLPMANQLVKPR